MLKSWSYALAYAQWRASTTGQRWYVVGVRTDAGWRYEAWASPPPRPLIEAGRKA